MSVQEGVALVELLAADADRVDPARRERIAALASEGAALAAALARASPIPGAQAFAAGAPAGDDESTPRSDGSPPCSQTLPWPPRC